MIIKDKTIDGGKGFDWGKVSSEYAKYRDIYPKIFYHAAGERQGTLIIICQVCEPELSGVFDWR